MEQSNTTTKSKPKKVRVPRKVTEGPEGSIEMKLYVPPVVKDLLEKKIKEMTSKTGKTVSFYTLMQYLVTEENLNNADSKISEKIKEYEELKRKQDALGIHLI